MAGKQKKKQDPETRMRALSMVPVIAPHVDVEEQDNGELLLSYPVILKPLLGGIYKRLTGKKPSVNRRKLQLDALGSQTWKMIDGKKDVQGLIERFQQQHRLDGREAEVALTSFLRQLGRRGLIAMREKRDV
jgi:hypothetical protein